MYLSNSDRDAMNTDCANFIENLNLSDGSDTVDLSDEDMLAALGSDDENLAEFDDLMGYADLEDQLDWLLKHE